MCRLGHTYTDITGVPQIVFKNTASASCQLRTNTATPEGLNQQNQVCLLHIFEMYHFLRYISLRFSKTIGKRIDPATPT